MDYFAEERFQDDSSLSSRKPPHSVLQLMPDLRADGAFSAVLSKLREHGWNVAETARALDMPRSNLYKKIEKYQLTREDT